MESQKSERDKIYELTNMTVEALILGFNKEIYQGYYIPRSHEIEESVSFALERICGVKEDKKVCNFYDSELWISALKNPERLEKRVLDGVYNSLHLSHWEDNSFLDIHVSHGCCNLHGKWFYLIGDLFEFREGEKRKAAQRVKNYWNEKEMKNFRQIHKYIREHIKREYERRNERKNA